MSDNALISALKSQKLELMPQYQVIGLRLGVEAAKSQSAAATMAMKAAMLNELVGPGGHAKDDLAKRLFQHYIFGAGLPFNLTVADMQTMNSSAGSLSPGRIDLRKTHWQDKNIRKEWTAAMKAASKNPPYSGKVVWVWDDGAIANYTVNYEGKAMRSGTSPKSPAVWCGRVQFIDRFDLDPRWGWSPTNQQSRTQLGERRTRIGYVLNLGTDFNILSPWTGGMQGENEPGLTLR